MNRSSALALGLVGALLLAASVSAQTGASSSQTDADRVSRRCTTGTLAPGGAQCEDDAAYDGPPLMRGTVGVGNIPPVSSGSNPPTVTPVVGAGNPASVGTPGSLSTNPPSLSNTPPSLISPGNTPSTGTTGGAAAAPAQPAASAMGAGR